VPSDRQRFCSYLPLIVTKPEELTPEEEELLSQALSNLQQFIKAETTHYVFVEDPRNDEDYDTFEYGTEPLPNDETWKKSETEPSDS
jgi:hypothetical protein